MRIAHKLGVVLIAILLLLILLLVPRHGHGQSTAEQDFGDYVIHYSAIYTNQLLPDMARRYAIERAADRGLINVAVEEKGKPSRMVRADVNARVSDLFGHEQRIRFRETEEDGQVDYLGTFRLNGSGSYRFTVHVVAPGATQPYVVSFNRDYVVD